MFKIYVADLERYNSGLLVGKWFDLNDYSDADDLQDDINEMLQQNNNEEWAVHDYDCSLDINFGEYPNLEQLIEVAEALEDNEDLINAIAERTHTSEFIEIIENGNLQDCYLLSNVTNNEELGRYQLEQVDDTSDIPQWVLSHFDYESYGRELDMCRNNSTSGHTSYGYLQCNFY